MFEELKILTRIIPDNAAILRQCVNIIQKSIRLREQVDYTIPYSACSCCRLCQQLNNLREGQKGLVLCASVGQQRHSQHFDLIASLN